MSEGVIPTTSTAINVSSSALAPVATSSGNTYPHVFSVGFTELQTSELVVGTKLRTLSRIGVLNQIFAHIVVKSVVIDYMVTSGVGRGLSIGLVPSRLIKPNSRAALQAVPHAHHLITNSTTSTWGRIEYGPHNVPGIEWDLAIDPIQFGHPCLMLGQWGGIETKAADVQLLISGVLTINVECSGRGFGGNMGGADAFS